MHKRKHPAADSITSHQNSVYIPDLAVDPQAKEEGNDNLTVKEREAKPNVPCQSAHPVCLEARYSLLNSLFGSWNVSPIETML